MRATHASRESSAEPGAIRSIFLPDVEGALLEAPAVGAADAELMDALDEDFVSELIDGLDEGFISSPAQPAVSRAKNAIVLAILRIPALISLPPF
jgi:hypothetical protein